MHQNGSGGYFFHFSCDCWNESLKKEAKHMTKHGSQGVSVVW